MLNYICHTSVRERERHDTSHLTWDVDELRGMECVRWFWWDVWTFSNRSLITTLDVVISGTNWITFPLINNKRSPSAECEIKINIDWNCHAQTHKRLELTITHSIFIYSNLTYQCSWHSVFINKVDTHWVSWFMNMKTGTNWMEISSKLDS